MNFVETDLETSLKFLGKLKPETKPEWGEMSAQRMVEHLTDTIRMANSTVQAEVVLPEETVASLVKFLDTDKEMAKNIEVNFAEKNVPLRNEELEEAVDEYVEEWLNFEEFFDENPTVKTNHPYYGALTKEQWLRLHSKHITHHFKQFGLISSEDLN